MGKDPISSSWKSQVNLRIEKIKSGRRGGLPLGGGGYVFSLDPRVYSRKWISPSKN